MSRRSSTIPVCSECGKDISHRGPLAITCGDTCRNFRWMRRKTIRAMLQQEYDNVR